MLKYKKKIIKNKTRKNSQKPCVIIIKNMQSCLSLSDDYDLFRIGLLIIFYLFKSILPHFCDMRANWKIVSLKQCSHCFVFNFFNLGTNNFVINKHCGNACNSYIIYNLAQNI